MRKACLAILLLLAAVPFSFGQTSDEVVSLLYEIDEESTKFGREIVLIEEFNFGIPGGKNWLVEWESSRNIHPIIYAVDINTKETLFSEFVVGSITKNDVFGYDSYYQSLPGHTMNGGFFQIGDFNGDGLDEILYFWFGAGGPSVEITGFDPEKWGMELLFSQAFDEDRELPPVKFVTYKGMRGFMLRRGDGYQVAGGPDWVPEPPSPQAGKWFFYTWDGEQRTFVEIGEVGETLIESEWQPTTETAQTENRETEIEPETTEQRNLEISKQEKAETQNPDLTNRDFAKQESVKTQNLDSSKHENPKSGSPVLMLAIIGGAILVSGIATIAVLAKRRKGKATK